VYVGCGDGALRFRRVKAPACAELTRLAHTIARRVGRFLERKGLLARDAEHSYLVGKPMDRLLGSSITYRIAVGPHQGREVFTLQSLPAGDAQETRTDTVGKVAGFSLHAGVTARTDERENLERLPLLKTNIRTPDRIIATMTLSPTPAMLETLYWITLLAVVVSSASGVLKAGFMKFDLFGVIIIAIATGLGSGSLRDMLLDRDVFWIRDQMFFIASLGSAIAIFIAARLVTVPPRFFLVADAAGLATFAIAGTLVSLMVGASPLVASFMGVMTGTMGGIFRDVLCGERPVVFLSPLYATVSWGGSLIFIALIDLNMDITRAAIIAGVGIFISRLLAIRYNISLPRFRFKQ
jgi:uncharacterized membrane protein YeiH